MKASDLIAAFGHGSGRLLVGGVPVDRLAARTGGTPFFAYDRGHVTARVAHVRSVLPPDIQLGYAVKANPMPALVQHLAGLVDAFDVASAGEMRTALDTTVPASRVSFAGPGKTDAELTQAIAAGVIIEIESENEAVRVAAAGDRLGLTPRVAIRVNPDFAVKGSGMRMGGGPQQFGVDAERVPALFKDLARAGMDVLGLHIFAGSQCLDAGILCEAQRRTADLAVRLAGSAAAPIRYLNIGGGFGIPYTDRDSPLDLRPIGENLGDVLARTIRPQLPSATVAVELGRYLVGECGVYVTRVVDRKESRGKVFLVVDGGMHHQLAASGNLGQVIRRNFPLAVGTRADAEPVEQVTVVGSLCTPLDLLGDNATLPRADVGDLIVIFQAGAYGLTASPTSFLSHPAPVEALI